MAVNGRVVVVMFYSHRWSPGSIPWGSHIYSLLLNKSMGRGITRLCAGDVSWLLQNDGKLGCGNSGTGACWRTVEDGWWIFSIAYVDTCWRLVHWQTGIGCVGSQGSYLTARKPSWEQNGLPPIVNIM